MNNEWVEIDSAEDVQTSDEILLWDGCDYHIDYAEYCPESGMWYFANLTSGATHYKLLISPLGEDK